MTPDRIPCCVPFCRRTAARQAGEDDQEIICGKHIMMASKPTRLLYRRIYRKVDRAMDRQPVDCTLAEIVYVQRLIAIADKAWKRMKKEVIEAAGGLG